MHSHLTRACCGAFWIFCLSGAGPAQSPTASAPAKTEPELSERNQAIQSLIKQLDEIDKSLALIRERLGSKAPLDVDPEAKRLLEERSGLKERFERIAAGQTGEELAKPRARTFDLTSEINELAKPAVEALKQATERPRRMEELRGELSTAEKRAETVSDSLATVVKTLAELPKAPSTDTLRKALETLRKDRERELGTAQSHVSAVRVELDDLQRGQYSVLDTLTHSLKSFFLTRGRNLFLALAAAVGTFVFFRWAYDHLSRLPWLRKVHGTGGLSFTSRIFHVISLAATGLGSVIAGLTVFYIAGDWLLLGLCLIALLGVALAAKHGLPKFYRQARLLMNLGEVREGERIVYQGVPWLVKSLNLVSQLENPVFRGEGLRLPLEKLVDQLSRPHDVHEPWFPCLEGDWLLLQDGTHGKAVMITPECVQLIVLGGARKTYPTAGFLNQHPLNISHGFRIRSTFAVDYAQLPLAEKVCSALVQHVTAGLHRIVGPDGLIHLNAELKQASPSWMEVELLGDFHGRSAEKHNVLCRAFQRLAMEASIEQGWGIPLPQVVHRQGEPVSTLGS
jgi:predicted  nucleic acid-binding Zn-ribbon protein